MDDLNRRDFLLTSAVFAAAACGSSDQGTSPVKSITPPALSLSTGATILFQGDSVTDAGHSSGTINPNDAAAMGYGYAMFVAQKLLFSLPNKQLLFYNRGRGGDTVPLLQQRWQTDAIDLQPDVLSILIGLNDFAADYQDPNVATIYEQNYTALINTTLQALPNVKLVIMEPYVMSSSPVPGFQAMRDAAARVAQQANAIYVPLQDMLNQHASEQTATYWVADHGHPTIAGSAAIANQWLQYTGL